MTTTSLRVGEFAMSKGGAFTLEIPMLLSLCVSMPKVLVIACDLAFQRIHNAHD